MEPSHLTQTSSGERLTLDVVVENHVQKQASTIYAVEFVDDVGTEISAPAVHSSATISASAEKRFPVQTPRNLGDGFYVIRVSVAGTAGDAKSADQLETYLEVDDGKLFVVDSATYFGQSRANQMRRLR